MAQTTESHYTFGDNDVAADRLELLASAFEASSSAWLKALELSRGLRVADLGCGPGLTTALLSARLAPRLLFGLDQSKRLIARAKRAVIADHARFFVHDLTELPFPTPPVDLLYVRFLLTHLAEPSRVLSNWARAVVPEGQLLLEEVALLDSNQPHLRRYYEKVEALQAHYGQSLYIGSKLAEILAPTPWKVAQQRIEPIELPAPIMARLHRMNLDTWGRDPFAVDAFDADDLRSIADGLDAIAAGSIAADPVRCEMAQLALVRKA